MGTERLYYNDSYLTAFDAVVVAHGQVAGRPAVALDRSAFYPEGGGQPADHGALNGCAVDDVQVDGETVWHVLARPDDLAALPKGATVKGGIDWARRLDHMQQHCGQHILTAAFIATGGPATLSFHLSDASVTIDVDTPALSEEQIRAAEELANRVIWQDLPVLARFVGAEELEQIALRKPPSVSGPVRVVSVADFDHSACGGTHPRSTAQVGPLAILRTSRQRGGTRVEFACGGRVLRELRRVSAAASAAASALSVGVDELPQAAERTLAAQKASGKELALALARLDAAEALRLYEAAERAGAARLARASIAELSAERLRVLAQQIAAQPGGVAILGTGGARASLAVACALDSGRSAQELLMAGLPVLEGKGGGTAQLAQGGGPRVEALEQALDAILAAAR
jgi:alanyl-tRNA synthetase